MFAISLLRNKWVLLGLAIGLIILGFLAYKGFQSASDLPFIPSDAAIQKQVESLEQQNRELERRNETLTQSEEDAKRRAADAKRLADKMALETGQVREKYKAVVAERDSLKRALTGQEALRDMQKMGKVQ